ncbi:MAG: hypothetical protein ETSY2_06370 [Candidatus Entotheonella gemina]|uniref:Uncharacterized protein n=1 Tax=Candidatus Entotheonella gemina TaxID=1429439 RepID=W4MF36_9BACT|nr:MAG: hypothetical protein ETSY2_06370 [Candidatus Entotheonella gemina]
MHDQVRPHLQNQPSLFPLNGESSPLVVYPNSSKPDQMQEIIEKVSLPPYLELFGRRLTPGWSVWGNEITRTLFDQEVLEI